MRNILLLFFSIFTSLLFSQKNTSKCDSTASALFQKNKIRQQWVYKSNLKGEKKVFFQLNEFNSQGALTKIMSPDSSKGNKNYLIRQFTYDDKGFVLSQTQGEINKDSVELNVSKQSFTYINSGILNHIESEIYDGEKSQTTHKWDLTFNDKLEKTGINYTLLLVKKDTITYDQQSFSMDGSLKERSIRHYFPKGISDYLKFDTKNTLTEFMTNEKGLLKSHLLYNNTYDSDGKIMEVKITNENEKTTEINKYEKNQITRTKFDAKGKLINTSIYPLPKPTAMPILQEYPTPQTVNAFVANVSDSNKKERKGKNGCTVLEYYLDKKLSYSETIDPKGLLIEKKSSKTEDVLQYEYTSF